MKSSFWGLWLAEIAQDARFSSFGVSGSDFYNHGAIQSGNEVLRLPTVPQFQLRRMKQSTRNLCLFGAVCEVDGLCLVADSVLVFRFHGE